MHRESSGIGELPVPAQHPRQQTLAHRREGPQRRPSALGVGAVGGGRSRARVVGAMHSISGSDCKQHLFAAALPYQWGDSWLGRCRSSA